VHQLLQTVYPLDLLTLFMPVAELKDAIGRPLFETISITLCVAIVI